MMIGVRFTLTSVLTPLTQFEHVIPHDTSPVEV